jgi:hypothetical protein
MTTAERALMGGVFGIFIEGLAFEAHTGPNASTAPRTRKENGSKARELKAGNSPLL